MLLLVVVSLLWFDVRLGSWGAAWPPSRFVLFYSFWLGLFCFAAIFPVAYPDRKSLGELIIISEVIDVTCATEEEEVHWLSGVQALRVGIASVAAGGA